MTMKFINLNHRLRLFETIKTFKLLKKKPMQVVNYLKNALMKKRTLCSASQCNIDGERPATILKFSSKFRFNLQPLFFAYEDHVNITDLIRETLEGLAVAEREVLSEDLTAKTVWENIDNFMTDSIPKNLEVENYVAEKLVSHHIPDHLLCEARVIEKFDETNEKILSNIQLQL